jgi:hypothetical protein
MNLRSFAAIVLLLFSINISAVELAGVKLDETVTTNNDTKLVLNGAGIRYKLFIKVYVGALYLEKKSDNASNILDSNQTNRVLMHFIYDGISKKKLINGWNSGFDKNLDATTRAKLKPDIDKFNAMFTDIRAHDEIMLDYSPSTGTRVVIKGKVAGIIEGEEFNKALLQIWIGKHPVTSSLKDSMLGKN